MKIKVVTYIEPHTGAKLDVCQPCQVRTPWPKTQQGREYCQVYKGLHLGGCDICGAGNPAARPQLP